MVKENIFTFPVSTGTYQQFIDEIFNLSEHQFSSYVCFANVHMVIEAYNNPGFNTVVRGADIVTPDGKPVALFLRLKKIKQVRVAGLDVFPDLLREAEHRGKSVYFYGTTDEILDKIEEKARFEYPGLNIAGLYSPPFRKLSTEEEIGIVNQINAAKPDLVLVALGCPKQEQWMADHKSKIKGCMLGLGHAFKVYAGVSKRCPKWMQRLSLEWAYRLYQEPGRLWKRYFYTNSLFVLLTLKYLITRRSVSENHKRQIIFKCEYNVVLVPLQRFSHMMNVISNTLDQDLREICTKERCVVKELNIKSNYIHFRVSIPPEITISNLTEKLKQNLSAVLFKKNPSLKSNYPAKSFWTNGYFVSTDVLQDDVMNRYARHELVKN